MLYAGEVSSDIDLECGEVVDIESEAVKQKVRRRRERQLKGFSFPQDGM